MCGNLVKKKQLYLPQIINHENSTIPISYNDFSSLNAQIASLETVRNFWDKNIMEIIRLDNDKIIEHTNYPVEGSWGYVLELEG